MTFEKEIKEKVLKEIEKGITPVGKVDEITLEGEEFRKLIRISIGLTFQETLKRVEEAIDKKIKEFKDWMEENPQKDGIYLVAEGCVKVLVELKKELKI